MTLSRVVVPLRALFLVACGGSEPSDASAPTATAAATTAAPATTPVTTAPATTVPTTTPTTTTPVAPGLTVTTADSRYGAMLFDGTGQAIYLFDLETDATARCYDACAIAWPPVLTQGPPVAAAGARPGLLGTTERDDGTTQVTYAGHPLYYYVDDGPFEVLCHDVVEFGGLWLVVTPAGEGGPH